MSALILPSEILQDIFKHLKVKELINCRLVCKRWRETVDSVSDAVWKKVCAKIYNDEFLQAAHGRANISWQDLYKSFALWSKIEHTTVKGYELLKSNNINFQILQNGVIGIAHNRFDSTTDCAECIVYYDLQTFEECGIEEFDFQFNRYEENENFIVVVHRDSRLCITSKANKKRFFVGKLLCGKFVVLKNEVFFKNMTDIICVCRLEKKDGEVAVKTIELDDLEENIISVSYADHYNNKINILTDEGNIYCYSLTGKEYETCFMFDGYSSHILSELDEYRFDWSSPAIYKWIRAFMGPQYPMSKIKGEAICVHANIVILGSPNSLLNIYYNPYGRLGKLDLNNTKPVLSLDLKTLFKVNWHYRCIKKVDVIECANGHRVIVSTLKQVFVIDFTHKENEINEITTKSNNKSVLSKIGKADKRSISEANRPTIHKHNLRSKKKKINK